MKATSQQILKEISDDLTTYLKDGTFNTESFTEKIDPNLNIDNLDKLLRIHFVLTTTPEDEPSIEHTGVINFVKDLKKRLRRIKTNVKKQQTLYRGKVLGRINWKKTITLRFQTGSEDKTLFVCDRREKNYEIHENLVLKKLLSIIHTIIDQDLALVFSNSKDYDWIAGWIKEGQETDLRQTLQTVYYQNIYLRKIQVDKNFKITPRMVNRAKRSRNRLYKEAGYLLERYRRIMNHQLEDEEAKALLRNTFIAPKKTDVLFELYWVIKIIQQHTADNNKVPQPRLQLMEPKRGKPNLVAQWQTKENEYNKIYKLYHDSSGESFQFSEKVNDINESDLENEFLQRNIIVLKELNRILSGKEKNSLWGGRPDIVLEIYKQTDAEEPALESVFIGEVKYTDNINYAIRGLRELLEYIALIKKRNNHGSYFIDQSQKLFNKLERVQGGLFLDNIENLNIEVAEKSQQKIKVYQFGSDDLDIKIES